MRRFTVYPTNNIYGGPVNFDDLDDLNNQRVQKLQKAKAESDAKEQHKNEVIQALDDATDSLISWADPMFEELSDVVNSDIQQIFDKYISDKEYFLQCIVDVTKFNSTNSPISGFEYYCEPDLSSYDRWHEGPIWFWATLTDNYYESFDFDYANDQIDSIFGAFRPNANFGIYSSSDNGIELMPPAGGELVMYTILQITTTPIVDTFDPATVVSDVKTIISGFRDYIDAQCSKILEDATKKYLSAE